MSDLCVVRRAQMKFLLTGCQRTRTLPQGMYVFLVFSLLPVSFLISRARAERPVKALTFLAICFPFYFRHLSSRCDDIQFSCEIHFFQLPGTYISICLNFLSTCDRPIVEYSSCTFPEYQRVSWFQLSWIQVSCLQASSLKLQV